MCSNSKHLWAFLLLITFVSLFCDWKYIVNGTFLIILLKKFFYLCKYLSVLENAKIISKCSRFDLKSKKSINGEEKYYLTDLSFYFATNTDNRINYGPVLENIIYNYAVLNGYSVSIGKIGKLEVDFIVRDIINNDYAYIQVAKTIDNGIVNEKGIPVTEEREFRPLESIKDNYPKYVLTLDYLLQQRNGIKHENIINFVNNNKKFI